jgi:hypothetical protein
MHVTSYFSPKLHVLIFDLKLFSFSKIIFFLISFFRSTSINSASSLMNCSRENEKILILFHNFIHFLFVKKTTPSKKLSTANRSRTMRFGLMLNEIAQISHIDGVNELLTVLWNTTSSLYQAIL